MDHGDYVGMEKRHLCTSKGRRRWDPLFCLSHYCEYLEKMSEGAGEQCPEVNGSLGEASYSEKRGYRNSANGRVRARTRRAREMRLAGNGSRRCQNVLSCPMNAESLPAYVLRRLKATAAGGTTPSVRRKISYKGEEARGMNNNAQKWTRANSTAGIRTPSSASRRARASLGAGEKFLRTNKHKPRPLEHACWLPGCPGRKARREGQRKEASPLSPLQSTKHLHVLFLAPLDCAPPSCRYSWGPSSGRLGRLGRSWTVLVPF